MARLTRVKATPQLPAAWGQGKHPNPNSDPPTSASCRSRCCRRFCPASSRCKSRVSKAAENPTALWCGRTGSSHCASAWPLTKGCAWCWCWPPVQVPHALLPAAPLLRSCPASLPPENAKVVMAPLMPCQADLPGTSLTTPSASLEGCTSTSMAPNLPGRGGIADGRRQVCCEPRNGPARTMFRCQNIDAARSSTRCSEPRRMHRAKKFTRQVPWLRTLSDPGSCLVLPPSQKLGGTSAATTLAASKHIVGNIDKCRATVLIRSSQPSATAAAVDAQRETNDGARAVDATTPVALARSCPKAPSLRRRL
ncbi:hypothetical protein HaLaN_05131 [Haematococcus lacustris]|uniref:Uncharacterized protein n=1 Tax=Haematococcus lacustris TaxID=44745 RepID=A0A699YKT0_HAELA|nr:hypothetical protein HaLaN_05131 [Haematococcus lacustris]